MNSVVLKQALVDLIYVQFAFRMLLSPSPDGVSSGYLKLHSSWLSVGLKMCVVDVALPRLRCKFQFLLN